MTVLKKLKLARGFWTALLCFFLFSQTVYAGYCTGSYTCGAEVTECLGTYEECDDWGNCETKECEWDDCGKEEGCYWDEVCDDGYEHKNCTGSTAASCVNSPGCGTESCSGPNNESCRWVEYIPPSCSDLGGVCCESCETPVSPAGSHGCEGQCCISCLSGGGGNCVHTCDDGCGWPIPVC